MNTENIIWADVKGYEGYYQVSNTGLVRSLNRTIINALGHHRFYEGVLLKPKRHKCGYDFVEFSINGKRNKYYVHRLVASAFIENPLNKPQVNHLDFNKSNNHVGNLEFCTASENNSHAHKYNVANRIPALQNCKPLLDLRSNWCYHTIRDAAMALSISYGHLRLMMSGRRRNTTSLIYCDVCD